MLSSLPKELKHFIYDICSQRDHSLHLISYPRVKNWLGGCNQIDCIVVFFNPGNAASDIEPHWHYIGFGLSNLHGGDRVKAISGSDTPSGYELTFRLKRRPDDNDPPVWPTSVMQAVADKVFLPEYFFPGVDHLSCDSPLDASKYSRIQHLLISEDSELGSVTTPFGQVTFLQMVGVCEEELKSAQQGNGRHVIDLMKSVKGAGGPLLTTDMNRNKTVFELEPFAFSQRLLAWWNTAWWLSSNLLQPLIS